MVWIPFVKLVTMVHSVKSAAQDTISSYKHAHGVLQRRG